MLEGLLAILDRLWLGLIVPASTTVGKLLSLFTMVPMSKIGVPMTLQVFIVGAMTGICGLVIKRVLGVQEKEAAFLRAIEERKAAQEAFTNIPDWKMKEVLYKASDEGIDDIYNTYISNKFAWFGLIHLLPIFLSLYWLDTRPQLEGVRFLVEFHDSPLGVPGLSIPAVFFSGYLTTMVFNRLWKRINTVEEEKGRQEISRAVSQQY